MPSSRNANSYRRRNVLLSSGGVLLGGVLFVLAFIVFALQFLAPGFLPRLASPLWQAGQGATNAASAFTALFGNGPALTAERDRLALENLALHEENRTLEARLADLARLAGTVPAPEKRILAGVLARPPVSPYDTLVVATGARAGVRVGAIAFGPGGVPVGTVATVSDSSSRIDLFSGGGRETSGWVGDTRIPVTLTGKGAGAFEATLPRGSGVAVNAVVYVPGPGALPIGTVVRIDSDPSSPRDTIHIAPYTNPFSLTWVEIAP